jgi:hypothetical protein
MENRSDSHNLDGPPTWTSPDLIKAGEHIWTPTEREFYNMGACVAPRGTGDELRFSSHRYHFWVIPMVQAHDNASFNEPRRPWHTGNARRPRYWAVAKLPLGQGPGAIWMESWSFKTQAEAREKAKELAHHDKVMDLLEVE